MATEAPERIHPQPAPEAASAARDTRKAARYADLRASDPQYQAAQPDPDVVAAKQAQGLRLAEVVKIVMEGYADRPALGARAKDLVTDETGRKTLKLLPRFETISYSDLWADARAIAADYHHNPAHPVKTGDFACILAFTNIDYAKLLLANIHQGVVNVPLQTSAPPAQHQAIIAETAPRIVAASIEYVDPAIDAILLGTQPDRLIVFDYDARDDDQRDQLAAARQRLADAGSAVVLETLDAIVARGRALPEPPLHVPAADEDPLSWLFYTSGSTGTPKGAMFPQSLTISSWTGNMGAPAITLSFMPMSHLVGNGYMLMALANGGTSYCAPKADLSTLFEDFALARPTMASIVPRVCELFHHQYLTALDKRISAGGDPDTADAELKREMREKTLGGRLLSVGCGSASLAPETYDFMESMLDIHMPIGYSSTEIAGGTVLVDWKVQRPPVIDYKLLDVPELGYFSTDKPFPRGELAVKTDRFMGGYYKRADLTAEKMVDGAYYRTGDVMAEHAPDHLVFVDRCNNVVKLSQGEFVAISHLEALYSHHPLIRQIYLYSSSERAFMLAVLVPSDAAIAEMAAPAGAEAVKARLRRALQEMADAEQLNSYEVPRDFLIETVPFSLKNGLLSEIGKHQRPKLKAQYGAALEAIYAGLAQEQIETLRTLRRGGADKPVLETVTQALQATLGIATKDVQLDVRFSEMGGDSLSALNFSTLLDEIFGIEVPVGVIISPAGSIRALASHIETERAAGTKRPSFTSVHASADRVLASELTLDKFIDGDILAKAPTLPRPDARVQTVLVTGSTGFLGRFQALAWLERLAASGGTLILLARGADAEQARARVEQAIDSDPELLGHFRKLAADHLEVLPGDLALPRLGLDAATWERLAASVDLIVHPAAHVNHVLPYTQLFAANVLGTAELIRLALTGRLKRFQYVSTLGVNGLGAGIVSETGDIRTEVTSAAVDDSYANGYGISKWAGEVLLREANDLCGLPVSVFRPGMILAHNRYIGQLNVPDMFTRLLFSLIATGIAPTSFYAADGSTGRPTARYDGLSVDFLANSVTAIGVGDVEGFHAYNLTGDHADPVSLDDFVDWMIAEGCPIERIDDYAEWLSRFETAMRLLPEDKRAESLLAILDPYRKPQHAATRTMLPSERFQGAAEAAGFGIPQISSALIGKYVSDLRALGWI